MKANIIFFLQLIAGFSGSAANENANIFTDYLPTDQCKAAKCAPTAYTAAPKVSKTNEEDIFTDYCQPELCYYIGADGIHSGCKDGVRHNGVRKYLGTGNE